MWKATQHAPEEIERFRDAPAGRACQIRVLPRALPREPREPRSRGRSKSFDALGDDGDRDGDRSRLRRLPRRLAPRLRIRRRGEGRRPGTSRAPRAHDGRSLALPRERRGCGRHHRPLGCGARRALRRAGRAPAPRSLRGLVPLVGVRCRRHRRGSSRSGATRPRRADRARAAARAACERREDALGSNRDRHDVVAEGVLGDGLATFLGHPAFRELPALLETWPKGGLSAADMDLLRDLYRRGRRRKRPRP